MPPDTSPAVRTPPFQQVRLPPPNADAKVPNWASSRECSTTLRSPLTTDHCRYPFQPPTNAPARADPGAW
ncbi:MAG: hypothetical protein OXF50_02960 [Caldilineaceae bacterium]|nr:hypothetical protein [Caldilineaceae bacterium]